MPYRCPKIIVATGNRGKLKEITEIFSDIPGALVAMSDYFKEEPFINETGTTFFENACIKADWVFHAAGMCALADDSGLMVDALAGAPGVNSARYAGTQGDTAANNAKLLAELKGLTPSERTAQFVCSVVLRVDENNFIHAEGKCTGRILECPRGGGGFGYDPLFVPDGFNRTFAELNRNEKHRISHRGKALRALKEKFHATIIRKRPGIS